MKTVAVIGAGHGDEGKGLMVDSLAAPFGERAVVVRSNGGSQAGHTVVLPDGRRHINSHVGSGTLAGAHTYLSRHFVSDPTMLLMETEKLAEIGIEPIIYADMYGRVTTPFDVFINQSIEIARGHGKHGSCGAGFGETIQRNESEGYGLCVGDFVDYTDGLRRKLLKIQNEYLPNRLSILGISDVLEESPGIMAESVVDNFIDACKEYRSRVILMGPEKVLHYDKIIFEGAQGLLLDQNSSYFPHVTRSNTGIQNVSAIAERLPIDEIEVVYVTRAYRTRHGVGKLKWELSGLPCSKIVDPTNEVNPWQDAIRYADLDVDELGDSIYVDMQKLSPAIKSTRSLAVTCMDQLDEYVSYFHHGKMRSSESDNFVSVLQQAAGADTVYISQGPTRETMLTQST